MPYIVAALVIHEKFVYADGGIVEIKAWQVPKSEWQPDGYKYSFVYINSRRQRALGYDNSKRQGHHKHIYDKQMPVKFESLESLLQEFILEVQIVRGEKI